MQISLNPAKWTDQSTCEDRSGPSCGTRSKSWPTRTFHTSPWPESDTGNKFRPTFLVVKWGEFETPSCKVRRAPPRCVSGGGERPSWKDAKSFCHWSICVGGFHIWRPHSAQKGSKTAATLLTVYILRTERGRGSKDLKIMWTSFMTYKDIKRYKYPIWGFPATAR